jgi:type I restriction enzyme S subunit
VGNWQEKIIGDFLVESRVPGHKGNVARKITVKLWGNGVFEKNETTQGSINTQYFRRRAGQFIYSKLDFLNQAFGLIPPHLDDFESTVDLPCFDISAELNPIFLLEYVKRTAFYERLGETADGSRKARRIHSEVFLTFPILFPTPAEQQKIASCLSSLDELIAAQARKLEALRTHKKALMQQLFPRDGETTPRLRFPEFHDAGEWRNAALKTIAMINPRRDVRHDDTSVTFVPMNAVSEGGFLAVKQTRAYGAVKKGFTAFRDFDIILAKITPCFENGKAALVSSLSNGIGFGSTEFHVIRAEQTCLPAFIFAQLHTDDFRRIGKASMTGSGGQQRVPTSFLEEYGISCPSLAEQHRIVACLTSLDDLITAQTQKLAALRTHKKALMQQLFPSPEEATA